MTEPDKSPESAHEEAASLIWYVTGALPAGEHLHIQRHLDSCAACREALKELIALRADVRSAYDAEPGPSKRARLTVLERIKSAVSSEPVRSNALPRKDSGAQHRSLLARLEDWLRASMVLRWAPVAALALIVVQAGVLVRVISGQANISGVVATRAIAPVRTRLQAVFNPAASELQIRQFLGSLDARIVDGPSSGGVYVIEISPRDPKSLGRELSAARANGGVLQSLEIAPP
jgi:anti-sigma factor RsiW